jgi:hypothetical protein
MSTIPRRGNENTYKNFNGILPRKKITWRHTDGRIILK